MRRCESKGGYPAPTMRVYMRCANKRHACSSHVKPRPSWNNISPLLHLQQEEEFQGKTAHATCEPSGTKHTHSYDVGSAGMRYVEYTTTMSSDRFRVSHEDYNCKIFCSTTVENIQSQNESIRTECASIEVQCQCRLKSNKQELKPFLNWF